MSLLLRLFGKRLTQLGATERPASVAEAEAIFRDRRGGFSGKAPPSGEVGAFASELFLDAYAYYRRYPDVAASPVRARDHFLRGGEAEGRVASDRFDAGAYVKRYPDVATFVPGPLTHYLRHGFSEPLGFDPLHAQTRLPESDRLREAFLSPSAEGTSPAALWLEDLRWGALASAAEAPAWIGREPMPDALRWLPPAPGTEWALGPAERLQLARLGLQDPSTDLHLVPPKRQSDSGRPSEPFSLHILTVVAPTDASFDLCVEGVARALRLTASPYGSVRWTLFVRGDDERRRRTAALPSDIRPITTVLVGARKPAELRQAALAGCPSWVLTLAPSQILLGEAFTVLSHYAARTNAALICTPPVLLSEDGEVLSYVRFDRPPAAVLGLNAQRSLRCLRRSLLESDGGERFFETEHAWLRLADRDICAPPEHLHLESAFSPTVPIVRLRAAVADELDRRFAPTDPGESFSDAEVGCFIPPGSADPEAVRQTVDAVHAADERLRVVSPLDPESELPPLLAVIPVGARPTPAFAELARAQAESGAEVVFGRTVVRQADGALVRGPELVPPAALWEGARIPAAACLFTRACLDKIGPAGLAQLLAAGDAAPTMLLDVADRWLAVDVCAAEITDGDTEAASIPAPPPPDGVRLRRLSRFAQTLLARLEPSLIERLQARLESCD